MKIRIKSFSGELICTIKCKQTDSVYDVILKCRKEHPTIFKLISVLPVYRELNQLNNLYEEFIYKNRELYVIFNEELPKTIEKVKQNGMALEYACEELKNDKEVVLESVKRRGYTVRYAGEELRNDKEVVIAAVKMFGYALEYASNELKNDKESCLYNCVL